ncbi:MAG: prolyl oligopeptidase family serine peptidase [Gammaproteobacteria bacterium]
MRIRSHLVAGTCLLGIAVAASEPSARQPRAAKKPLTLERLYAYPKLEGTAPERPKWSPDGRFVAFTWNEAGYPFRDLWLYDTSTAATRRVTRLEQAPDDWTATPAEKDRRLRAFPPPDTGLADFQWAPDSSRLAFEHRGELYLVASTPEATLTRLTFTRERESNPRFSPDSRALAFVAHGELFVRDLASGAIRQLTAGGGIDVSEDDPAKPGSAAGTYRWSPDGRWLAFQQERDDEVKGRLVVNFAGERVTSRRQNWRTAAEGNARARLGVTPRDGGPILWLTPLSDDYHVDWEWSPDSTRIALLRKTESQKQRHVDVLDVTAARAGAPTARAQRPAKPETTEAEAAATTAGADPAKAWTRTVFSERDERWVCDICDFVTWSPDGRLLAFASEASGWNHLYVVAPEDAAATARQLTSGEWEVTDYRLPTATTGDLQPAFSRDGRAIYFTANRSALSERHLYRVWVDDGRIDQLTTRRGVNVGIVAPDDRQVAYLSSSLTEPWELFVGDTAGTEGRAVTRSPLPEFHEYEWPAPRTVTFRSRDGKAVRALLFVPPSVTAEQLRELDAGAASSTGPARGRSRASTRYPVINFVHGAGYAQAVLDRWGGYMTRAFQFGQFAAQQGYVVIDVDYRGSAGYGREWRTDVYLHLGGKDLDDELASMDFLRTLSWVDTDRAGIWGISYGGFMTLMAMFRSPGTFLAGSAWAAVTDWENYDRSYTQQRLRTPAEQPEAYARSSPLHHVAGLAGALQLQHGIMDSNVHFQDTAQLTDALVAAGKPFSQQFYPQEDHVAVRPEVWTHATRSLLEFFDRHLSPAPRPSSRVSSRGGPGGHVDSARPH